MTLPSPNPNSSIFLPRLPESDQSDLSNDHDRTNKLDGGTASEETTRDRLTRHRVAVAGQVWIPDKWGKEELLKDWIDGSAFEASLFPSGIMSARRALARDAKRLLPNNNTPSAAASAAGALRILNSC